MILKEIKQFLEKNSYRGVVIDNFKAIVNNDYGNKAQICIDSGTDSQLDRKFVYERIRIIVKGDANLSTTAYEVSNNIIELFEKQNGGRLVENGIQFARINIIQRNNHLTYQGNDTTNLYASTYQFNYKKNNFQF